MIFSAAAGCTSSSMRTCVDCASGIVEHAMFAQTATFRERVPLRSHCLELIDQFRLQRGIGVNGNPTD